jgi:hypothetical protein
MEIIIKVARDFTKTPGGRFKSEGPYSGEEFRDTILKNKYLEATQKGEKLFVDLDGCRAYPPSFLDEAFGGLARNIKDKSIIENIIIKSDDEIKLKKDIEKYMRNGLKDHNE